jgi:hypothetical protein
MVSALQKRYDVGLRGADDGERVAEEEAEEEAAVEQAAFDW